MAAFAVNADIIDKDGRADRARAREHYEALGASVFVNLNDFPDEEVENTCTAARRERLLVIGSTTATSTIFHDEAITSPVVAYKD